MKQRTTVMFLAAQILATACLPASAAWYDDPSIIKKVPLAVNASGTVDPHFMNKSEDDSLLLVNLQASGDNAPTVLIDMKALADKSTAVNDVTIRRPVAKPSEGYGAEWKGGAVSAKLGIALMGGGLSSETCALTTGDGKWVKGIGLLPLSTSNGMKTDGLDFSADSSFVYSTEYDGGDRGKIARWTYDKPNGRLVFVKDFQTSLTRIRNISVYTVDGKELVYCGEGTGTSAAAKVVAIDVSGDTWTETVVSSGIAGLTGDITNVKLSNENDANPVMYVLCDSGKLAVCRLASDGLSVSETVKTFDTAALHALAGGTTTAKFRNFEVTKDGKTAFLVNRIDTHNANLCVLATSAYIESDGTQFMNTGYYPGPKTKIEVDFQLTEAIKGKDCIFGNYGDANFSVLLYAQPETQSKQFQFCGKDGGWQGQNSTVLIDTTRHTMIIDVPKKKGTMFAPGGTIQGQADFNSSWTYTNTASWPIAFFASCNSASGNSARQGAKVKIYGAKIWESEDNGETYTLLHDYSPAIKNGIAGLVDSKTGTFLYDTRANGTWTFATGGDIETIDDDPYVESDGTSAINLGVSASPKLKIALDYALLEGNDLQDRLLGQDTKDGLPRFSAYINGSGNIALAGGTDTAFNNVSTGIATNTVRHTVVIDNVALRNAYMTGVTTNWSGYGTTKADCTTCATRPLALFGNTANDAGTSFNQCTKMKVYGLKIWAGDTLLRDLAPRCIDGTAGFEDRATGRFYTCDGLTASANAPTELTGPAKEGDAFIESDGSFYSVVNTYYFVKPSTKIEIDYALASIVSGAGVLGGYGGNAGISTILWCKNTSNFVLEMHDGSHAGTADNLLSPAVPLDLARHTAVIDGPGRHLTLSAHDGTVEGEADFYEDWTLNTAQANWPVLLFGFADDAYGHNKQRAKARIYGVKFYENGSPVLTLTPAVKGGVAGFKDGNGNFYSGDGLIAGGAVETLDEDPYVENPTDGRFFDTGYYVTSNTCIKIDYMPLVQQTTQQFPFEAGSSANATAMFMRIYGNGSAGQGDIAYACGQFLWQSLNVPYAPHVRRQVTVDAYNLTTKIETAGQTIRETTIADSGRVPQRSSNTLKLLSNSTMNANSCKARLYGVQIYEEGTLVRDYVPICQGGTYALLDKVNGTVLAKASNSQEFNGYPVNNALDDAFFNAPMRDEDAYIESDGTQGINLGYFTTPNTRYEIDYQFTNIGYQNRPFGAAASGAPSSEIYVQGNGNVAFGAGDSWTAQITGVAADLNRHVAVLDIANHECGYSGYKMFAFTSATLCTKTVAIPTWLFAQGTNAAGGHGNHSKMKLYAFRIYESGALVHEYLPYKNGDTVGLYDTVTGDVKLNSVNGANAFAYGGGMGYGKFAGIKTVLTTSPVGMRVKPNRTATLTAFAPGAIRYVWTRNGEVLAGATGPEITVVWESPKTVGGTPVYGVTPVFLKDGVEVLGEEVTAEVTMLPLGMMIILR